MVTVIELIGSLRPAEHMQMGYYFSAILLSRLISQCTLIYNV